MHGMGSASGGAIDKNSRWDLSRTGTPTARHRWLGSLEVTAATSLACPTLCNAGMRKEPQRRTTKAYFFRQASGSHKQAAEKLSISAERSWYIARAAQLLTCRYRTLHFPLHFLMFQYFASMPGTTV